MKRNVRDYYRDNPLMVSSPFGGVDGIDRDLLLQVFAGLDLDISGRNVLDVGCGRGYLGDLVREQGSDYTGVDFVQSRGGFRMALGDAPSLPFADAVFDLVCCIDAFEHFPDEAAAAGEFRRVLRPAGRVFLSVPNYANVAGVVKKACETVGWYRRDTWAPFRNWQPQEYERALTGRSVRRAFQNAGFSRFRRVGHGPEVGLGLLPWMAHKRMPEAIRLRLERFFVAVGPAIVRLWPGASLHAFWRIDL
ncbi:MAG TPA: class I SAM-dependent methyltransferase [Candidatus Hydrogenedentes bacterium]|nr:class I SAM-dependent methyltransferase [Candidatus Hydrogenedentota bacterium]HIJ74025.1 class I SAM-dependent methyltransferase [Candidatus Hydrogenedentota bacterium]